MIEHAKQRTIPTELSVAFLLERGILHWNMNVRENLFPQEIKINVFLHKITKHLKICFYKSDLCYGL